MMDGANVDKEEDNYEMKDNGDYDNCYLLLSFI